MKDNWLEVCNSRPNGSNSLSTSSNQSKISCEYFRKRKLMWMVLFSIVLVVILVSIIVPTTIIFKKKSTAPQAPTTSTTTKTVTTTITIEPAHNIPKWEGDGIPIAGGNGAGNANNQLYSPSGICVDDERESIYIVDTNNHRIVEWKFNETHGQVVTGENEEDSALNKLYSPLDVAIDKKRDSLVICDFGHRRIVRWSRQNRSHQELIISNIFCRHLTIDNSGDLYVCDWGKGGVIRWREGDANGIIVAGGNQYGDRLDQLTAPSCIFVDHIFSVYVCDLQNHRVMKWTKDAKTGIVVAGGHGPGMNLTQLTEPLGVTVDNFGNIYITDNGNGRIMYWSVGANEGNILISQHGNGQYPIQFNSPTYLSFDRKNNLYVIDASHHRIRKFHINRN